MECTDLFYKDGLRFSCKRCSSCCGTSPGFVYLSERDLLLLCGFFNLTVKEFVGRYCRKAGYYGGTTVLALREKKNYDCILWNNGCTAYKARPIQCSTYPFWPWMLADRTTWNECAASCPGMNTGTLHPAAEISSASAAYAANTPVTIARVQELMVQRKSSGQNGGNVI